MITELIQSIFESMGEPYQTLILLLIYTALIIFYALFILKLFGLFTKREILKLNTLDKNSESKGLGYAIYFLENIILFPILVVLLFFVLSIFLIIFSGEIEVSKVMLISGVFIIVTRIMSYMDEDLSDGFSKIIAFGFLAIFLMSPGFFNFDSLIEKINNIPAMFDNIFLLIITILIVEISLRIINTLGDIFRKGKSE